MNEILALFKNQLVKMFSDGSWGIGAIGGGLSIAIPKWVTSDHLGIQHAILMGILLAVFIMEWTVGRRLATLSNVERKSSEVMIDSAIRDFLIIIICVIAYGFDYLLGTGSVIFTLFTVAFIYHNLYSLFANIVVLKWDKSFPMWLLNWLHDEIEAKKEKYFPEKKTGKPEQETIEQIKEEEINE